MKKIFIRMLCFCFLCALVSSCVFVYASEKDDIKNINNSIVRFHIRANGDDEYDQDIKMSARKYFFEISDADENYDKKQTLEYFRKNEEKLEKKMNEFLEKNGVVYKCDIDIKKEYFPVREYNDFVLPSGVYDAVILNLGSGKGKNFFCVMYPSLCLIDGISEKTKENFEKLGTVLDESELKLVGSNDSETVIKLKIIEILNKFF